jgi:ketosteroid isomerase-like protein
MNESDALMVAKRFIECLRNGDVEGIGALYHDDVIVWRNLDNRELVKAQVMKVVGFLAKNVHALAYDDVRVRPTSDGFVQTHVLRGTAPNGEQVNAYACLVVSLTGNQISRVDEYLDSAQLAPLMG